MTPKQIEEAMELLWRYADLKTARERFGGAAKGFEVDVEVPVDVGRSVDRTGSIVDHGASFRASTSDIAKFRDVDRGRRGEAERAWRRNRSPRSAEGVRSNDCRHLWKVIAAGLIAEPRPGLKSCTGARFAAPLSPGPSHLNLSIHL